MKSKCDVLVMIWGMGGRDAHALIPIIYLLREKYGLRVEVRSIFDYSAIDLLRPKVLLTNGCTGSITTFKVTKYASQRGVYTVALHAEGVFRHDELREMLWGCNKDERVYIDKWFMWNENAYQWSIEKYPDLRSKLEVSGSVGHEKYLMIKHDKVLRKKMLRGRFNAIIFYAAWGFDSLQRLYSEGKFAKNPESEKNRVVNLLRGVIRVYPDKLFILKYHPGTLEEEETEIYNYFNDCENVLIIRNEHPIYKLISISDVVIVYDSTTSVDSWLLNKTTIHLCYGDFGYSSIRDGSLTPKTLDELIKYLEEYFTNGHVKEFENKKNIRNEIIRDSFGNLQSKPSLMVADHIYKNLGHLKKKKCALSLIYFVRGVLNRVFYHCRWLPNIKVFSSMRQHYRPDLFTVEQEELYENMQCYYK